MITITGDILVRSIHGRYGQFNVGTLQSDIGQFSFKDQVLEELSEGTYKARCVIDRIDLGSFTMGNRMAVEMIASIYDVELLQDSASESDDHQVSEIDPVEEELSNNTEAKPQPVESNSLPDEPITEPGDTKEAQNLFGHLWPLTDSVQLDMTVNRAALRAQTNYLKSIGYKYWASDRVWVRTSN